MSAVVTGWVLEHSPVVGAARLVLLVLADHADGEGRNAFPGVKRIAHQARCSSGTVHSALRKLEGAGQIEREGVSAHRTISYRVLRSEGPEIGGSDLRTVDPPEIGPKPTTEPSVVERARAGARLKISGKVVAPDAWALTERVLTEFNRAADRKLRLITSAGVPSEAAKRIYGRITTYPDLRFEDHADIIRRTLASRWWGTDEPTIGVVYGPRIFEENITRQGVPRSASTAAKQARAAEDRAAIERVLARARGET